MTFPISISKIQATFRKYNLPEPGNSKPNAKNQYHFYKPLHNNDFQYLERFNHLATYNVEAPRYFLYLTTDSNGESQAIYLENNFTQGNLDKQVNLDKLLGRHRLSPELYNETILDGQIINDTFLISDLLVYKGQPMLGSSQNNNSGHSMSYRLSILDSLVKNHWQPDHLIDTYKWELKSYIEMTKPTKLAEFWQNRTKLTYLNKINGLIFRPNARSLKNFTVYLTQPHCHDLTHESEISRVFASLSQTKESSQVKQFKNKIQLGNQVQVQVHPGLGFAGTTSRAPAGKDQFVESPSKSKKIVSLRNTQEPCQFLVINDTDINKPDVYYLYSLENPTEKREVATITTLENSLKLQKIFQDLQSSATTMLSGHSPDQPSGLRKANCEAVDPPDLQSNGLKFQCLYRSRFRRWEPVNLIT